MPNDWATQLSAQIAGCTEWGGPIVWQNVALTFRGPASARLDRFSLSKCLLRRTTSGHFISDPRFAILDFLQAFTSIAKGILVPMFLDKALEGLRGARTS